jgi:nucleoside-diphosphate-sugar epimerase
MPEVLITGGSGFFGGVLKRRLLAEGFRCVNIDLVADADRHENLKSTQGDLRDQELLRRMFSLHKFEAVFHVAAMLAHGAMDEKLLWTSNVDGTRNIAEACREFGVPTLVFTSTNCLWGSNLDHAVAEDEAPAPIEIYGRSKLAAEQVLAEYRNQINVITLRCPTIIDSGRLGLLAILFEFIQDGKKVWVVGGGANRYQFIYAEDLAAACLLAMQYGKSDTFHIGSDHVKPLRAVYDAVIQEAKSRSRVASLPKGPAISAMKLAHKLGISPLGPYHYQMIAEDFLFDTTKIKAKLGWKPTLTNEQMLVRAYQYYAARRAEIYSRREVSAHSKPAAMGVIRLLKWIS